MATNQDAVVVSSASGHRGRRSATSYYIYASYGVLLCSVHTYPSFSVMYYYESLLCTVHYFAGREASKRSERSDLLGRAELDGHSPFQENALRDLRVSQNIMLQASK